MEATHLLGATCALASGCAWALGAVLFKKLSEAFPPVVLTFCKGLCSLLFLLAAMLFVPMGTLDARSLLMLILSGFLGITLGDTFFFAALRSLTPATLIVFLMLGQVLTFLMSVLLLGEHLPFLVWTGLAIVLAGVVIVLHNPADQGEMSAANKRERALGFFYAALSTVTVSVSCIIMKPALADINALHATFIRMAAAILLLTPYILATGASRKSLAEVSQNRPLLGQLLRATLVVTFGGFWMSVAAFKYASVPVASALTATEPVFALPLSWLLLSASISKREIAGAALSVGGIIIVYIGH